MACSSAIWLTLLLLGLCSSDSVRDEHLYYRFKIWQQEHEKFYRTPEEESRRLAIFRTNLAAIERLNQEASGMTHFSVNKFADLSSEEFSSKILMPNRQPPSFPTTRYARPRSVDSLPDEFDWRDKNVVTSVKDQGSAGTCWAFSTAANIEGQFVMAGGAPVNVSVEQIVDCDDSKDAADDRADCGVYGGWPFLAYQYIERAGGIESWDAYPYCAGDGKNPCFICPPGLWNNTLCGPPMPYCNMSQSCPYRLDKTKFIAGLKVVDWKAISENETEIASQLVELGPLSVALDATMLQFYHSGIFNPIICHKDKLNHAVLLVGYGTKKDIFGETPFWTVKNSWGASWGDKGYFYIKRGSGVCGINTQVTTAVLGK